MFRSLFPFRRLLATSLLLVFVNVLAGQCYCASLRQGTAGPVSAATAKPAPMLPGHACCRAASAKAHPTAANKTTATPPKHHSGADDCCRKKAASLVAGPDSPVAKLLVLAPAVLAEAREFHFRPHKDQWNRIMPEQPVSARHLPPKIPDIRIFIQSLTV